MQNLPLPGGPAYLNDGGLETTLVFHHGIDLREFAAYPLLATDAGVRLLEDYFEPYLDAARQVGAGFVIDTPTWRASADWGEKLGHGPAILRAFNREAVALARRVQRSFAGSGAPSLVSGAIGPRGDGYQPGAAMTAQQAADYHRAQIATFAECGVDLVTAYTMTTVSEASGIATTAREAEVPCVLSFTVETDGRLPDGTALGSAIEETDRITGGAVSYFMINCAHPSHFLQTIREGGEWRERIYGLKVNASCKSHAELDESATLDDCDPAALAHDHIALRDYLPNLVVFGGCCGTDHRHVAAIGAVCAGDARKAA